MATPAYATDLNDIWIDGGGTAWSLISSGGGGANSQTDPETDDFIQGSSSWSRNPWSSSIRGGVVNSAETIASGDAVYFWLKADAIAALATHAAGGMQALIGSGTGALDCFYVRGSDDYAYGGWVCVPVDPTLTPSTTIGTAAGTSYFGCRWNIPSSGPSKGFPFKVDAMRHGRQIIVTAGDSGDPATIDKLAAYDQGLSGGVYTRQWGIFQPTNTGAAQQGIVYWGSGSAVYSRDSNRTIAIIDTEWTASDFTQIIFNHASNDVVWDNIGMVALGTSNRGIIDIQIDAAITWTNSVFQGIGITNLLASAVFDGSKWLGCSTITNPGGSMVGCSVLAPTITANASALVWNVASDPDGELDGCEFSMGATSHHAIEFGTSSPTDITLRDCVFTGFNTITDNQNDSTLHIKRTTGTVTINVVGANGTAAADITYRSDGATVVISASAAHTIIGLELNTKVTYVDNSSGTELYTETATTSDGAGKYKTTYSYGTAVIGTTVDVLIMHLDYKPYEPQIVMPSADATLPVVQVVDSVYANP